MKGVAMQQYPLWATPARRARLAELFAQKLPEISAQFYRNLDRVMFGDMSLGEYVDFLTRDIGHTLIEYWKEDDRDERSYLWRLEKRRMHANPRKLGKRGGPYDSIHRDQLHAERPVFEIVGIGVSAFSQHRVAKVNIPELHKTVWIDLSGVSLSKNKLRKLARRGGKVPEEIHDVVTREVRRYL